MKKIYILGAGASRELKFNSSSYDAVLPPIRHHHFKLGPLSDGFFYYSLEFLKEIESKRVTDLPPTINIQNEYLKNFILNYYSRVAGINMTWDEIFTNETKSRFGNIEKLYSEIENAVHPYEEKQLESIDREDFLPLRAKPDFLEYVHSVFSALSTYCFSFYHRTFAEHLVQTGGDVISFNWDILLEEALIETNQWCYSDGYGFEPKGYIDKNMALDEEFHYRNKKSTNVIYKPHGSINWFELDQQNDSIYIGIPFTRQGAWRSGTVFSQCGLQRREMAGGQMYTSMIIPPGRKNISFPFIWDEIRAKLIHADKIICGGFSFNPQDTYVTQLFQNIKFKETLEIDVVNPEADIERKFKEIFHVKSIRKTHNTFGEYCEAIQYDQK